MPTFAQGRVLTFLRHTYSWRERLPDPDLPPVDDVDEAWGVQDGVYADPVSKPCIYHDGGVEMDSASGEIVRLNPRIRVGWDDPIKDNDLVMDIHDAEGRVLLQGPLRVMVTSEYAPHGPLLYRDIPLRATQVED